MKELNSKTQLFLESIKNQKKEINFELSTQTNLLQEYDKVNELLIDLPKKLKHEVMVPLGPLALMPGTLVNTNEYMVLLGENWFTLRSGEQSKQIIARRKAIIKTQIESLESDIQLLDNKAKLADNLFGEESQKYDEYGNKIVEIREEYHSSEEEENVIEVNIPAPKPKSKATERYRVKTQKEIEEERAIRLYLDKLEEEEKRGLHQEESEEEYKPYPKHREGEESEDEDDNYLEGLNYAMNGMKMEDNEEEVYGLGNQIKEKEKKQKGEMNKKEKGGNKNKKQVSFSNTVKESSHRAPEEFRENPYFDMLMRDTSGIEEIGKDDNVAVVDVRDKKKSIIKGKGASNKDTQTMKMKVIEKETPEIIDYDRLEGALEFEMINNLYHERRNQLIASQGGFSTSLEEREEKEINRYTFDTYEETPKKENGKSEEVKNFRKPKKVSKFKAARMAGDI